MALFRQNHAVPRLTRTSTTSGKVVHSQIYLLQAPARVFTKRYYETHVSAQPAHAEFEVEVAGIKVGYYVVCLTFRLRDAAMNADSGRFA